MYKHQIERIDIGQVVSLEEKLVEILFVSKTSGPVLVAELSRQQLAGILDGADHLLAMATSAKAEQDAAATAGAPVLRAVPSEGTDDLPPPSREASSE